MITNKTSIRKTIYIDEDTVKRCGILFGEADVDSFSQFVTKALNTYIDRLITENHSVFLTDEMKKTLQDEIRPIASRLSKGLYRYAIEIDMLSQILAYSSNLSSEIIDEIRKRAKRHVTVMRGKIDIQQLLNDDWIDNEVDEY